MIKFLATASNPGEQPAKVLGLGISEANVLKLKQGLPISIDLHDMGITEGPLRFIHLFYGGTDEELVRWARSMAGPETQFHKQNKAHEG